MANLSFQEKNTFEKLLDMESGYVSNFSNRTIQLFIGDFNIDIYDNKYSENGDSKAKRLRTLIKKESDYTVSLILEALLNYQIAVDTEPLSFGEEVKPERKLLYSETNKIISRLKSSTPVESISAIRPVETDTNFTILAESVRRSIENHNPVEALDRLHTYIHTW